jgi:glycosyltransferase involved in cell wall biosynthesis
MPRLRLVWEGDFSATSSVGQVNIELARHIADQVDLSIRTRTERSALPAPLQPFLDRALSVVDVHLRHGCSDEVTPPRNGAWVWMQPWELGAALPVDWIAPMGQAVDAVFVYSPWIREQFIAAGVAAERVMVSPPGVDAVRFSPHAPPRSLPTTKTFRFLNIGGTSLRKGHDLLLRAYLAAFTAADDVALVLKTFANDGRYESVGLLGLEREFAMPGAPEIVSIRGELPAAELAGLYTSCQAYVHPYRGEGFCLPLAEAMAAGVPIITTDRGGASCFCTDATARLLDSQAVYLPRLRLGRRALSNFPHWREPSIRELIAAMRSMYSNPASAQPAAIRGRALIAESFTWRHAAETLLTNLDRVRSVPPRRRRHAARRARVTLALIGSGDAAHGVTVGRAGLDRVVDEVVVIPPGDAAAIAAAKTHVLSNARTDFVCFFSDGQFPSDDFAEVLTQSLRRSAPDDPPSLQGRVVHHSRSPALAPLERFVPCVVRAGVPVQFDSQDSEVMRGVDADILPAREVAPLVIHQAGGEVVSGSTPIARDVEEVLQRHRTGDSAALLAALRRAAARLQPSHGEPHAHRSFVLTSYVAMAVASGASEEALRVATYAEPLCNRQPLYWVARGEAMLSLGLLETAAASFHRATGLELREGGRRGAYGRTALRALLGLAAIAASQGIVENAYRFHRYALPHAPDDRSLMLQTAALADASGRAREAVTLFAQALTLHQAPAPLVAAAAG